MGSGSGLEILYTVIYKNIVSKLFIFTINMITNKHRQK